MTVLWMNFFIVYMTSFFSRYFSKPLAMHFPYVRPNKLLILLASLSIIIVSGLRNNIGDTFFYMHSYQLGHAGFQNFNFKGDFGFNILQILLRYISTDPQILIITTALITNVLIIMTLYRYSRMVELSLFVYIAAGMFTVSMNGIRQCLAAAIVFIATKYILEGNFLKYLMVVLLASMIHKTALIFIPIYFIVRRKAWTKLTFIILFIGVIIAAEFSLFSKALFDALENTQYGHYSHFQAKGANILRVVVTAIPILFAFLGREKLRHLWPKSDYIVNLSLLGFVFMVISTKNWLFARFDIYFGLYSLILISWIIVLFVESNRKFIYYGIIVCYFCYFYYEQVISLGLVYRSYYLNW